jgi:competence ComEA-like helix-hairpin-helix protein
MCLYRLLLILAVLPTAVPAQSPDGAGKEETQRLCSQCHELARSFSLRQDRDSWQGTVDKMVTLGLQGKDDEIRTVVDYLARNFPGEAIPKVNINTASAIELESGLSLKRSEAAAVIAYRTKIEKFKSLEDLKEVPGVSFAKFEAKKDRLTY